jgi:hypothetical protein
LATLLHTAAVAACLIVVVSFSLFAFDQVTSASQQQQSQVAAIGPTASTDPNPATGVKPHTRVRRTIDDASTELGIPFHGIATRSSSVWGQHILETLLVLLVYGFTLGFAARFIRVHA